MSKPKRQLQRGKTLQRVRSMQELVAHQQAAQAEAEAAERKLEVERRRSELASLDEAMLGDARQGVSAKMFMRYQGLRQLHRDAVVSAELQSDKAFVAAEARREELNLASRRRRQAERLVEISQVRADLDDARTQQKEVDDANCVRACGAA